MIRLALIAVIGALTLVLAATALFATPFLWPHAIISALVLLALVYERIRYKALQRERPGGGFAPTPERFIDPESGAPVTVWIDPATGERRYVSDGAPPPGAAAQ